MEVLLANVVNQDNLALVIKVMVALFAKDFVSSLLRKLAQNWRTDKNPKNDVLIAPAEAAADVLDKVKFPGDKK